MSISSTTFASFLLASLKHFLDNEWDKTQTQKRGGQYEFVPWDEFTGEERYGQEPFHEQTAEKIFERRWALTVLETALGELHRRPADGDHEVKKPPG